MVNKPTPRFKVSDFLAAVNQSLEFGIGLVEVEGEVSSFKVNHQKYVFFDLKDETGSVDCFMTVWQLKTPIEDGMKVVVRATPKLTDWGKFSLTVQAIRPVGEGALKRASELIKQKLEKEGLFATSRKRALPTMPTHVGVISSIESAGYRDFIKILSERWAGLEIDVAHVPVQGELAPGAIVRALEYFNSCKSSPEVIAIVRGGGSLDDLMAFNDERVVRAIASSRVPTIVGVGHEVDETLSDLVADVRASTPTHTAQILVPNKQEVKRKINTDLSNVLDVLKLQTVNLRQGVDRQIRRALSDIYRLNDNIQQRYSALRQVVHELNPQTAMLRGYSLVTNQSGKLIDSRVKVGDLLNIETKDLKIDAEVQNVSTKNK